MRIVVAADAFKTTLSAAAACEAMTAGARSVQGSAEVVVRPMADGGEGTMEVLAGAWGVPVRQVSTVDAIGRPCRGGFLLRDGVAVVELAAASGLERVVDQPLRPLFADTFGTGVVIKAALDAGARRIVLFVGGSASTDGGLGILRALGLVALGARGEEVTSVCEVTRVDISQVDVRARSVEWVIATDVTNPLTGARGAAAGYGRQKGASDDDISALDEALTRWASMLGIDAQTPGFGAAGGVPAGLSSLVNARITSGAEVVADAIGLGEALIGADLVLTGEGRFDRSSMDGKVVHKVIELAGSVPVVVIAGQVGADAPEGIETVAISCGGGSLEHLRATSRALIEQAAARVVAERTKR